jgi:hypothetical protein
MPTVDVMSVRSVYAVDGAGVFVVEQVGQGAPIPRTATAAWLYGWLYSHWFSL